MPVQASNRSGRGQDPQSSCPGNRLRPAVATEFAIDDRVQREEKPGSNFWIGQPCGDELEYLEFTFAVRPESRSSKS